MDQLVDSDEEVEDMKKDLENVDKLHNEAPDLANEKSYKSAVKTINQGLEISPLTVQHSQGKGLCPGEKCCWCQESSC